MKIKNKGKVHPSPSSSSSTTTTTAATTAAAPPPPILATLQLLPTTILALVSVLPPPDQEVLSYLLARSLLSPDAKPSSSSSSSSSADHSSPSFDCGCFDCYTIYWQRWDSSPNRDLIHRVIDAFEDHLSSSSSSSNALVGKGKVRGGRGGGRRAKGRAVNRTDTSSLEIGDNCGGADGNVAGSPRSKKGDDQESDEGVAIEISSPGSPLPPSTPQRGVAVAAASRGGGGGGEHKGLARKVLPDVLGILNSRLWNLWSPNV